MRTRPGAGDVEAQFFTSLDYADHPGWHRRAQLPGPEIQRHPSVADEVRHFVQMLRGSLRSRVVLLQAHTGRFQPDLLVAAVLGLLPARRRPTVVLMGAMWQRDPGWRGIVQQILVRRADRAVTLYAVQSSEELESFPATWKIPPGKTRLCLYFATTRQDEPGPPAQDCRHVFSGGDSHRDYDTLLEVATHFPDRPFVLATRLLDGRRDLPANVTAGRVTPAEYDELMRTSAAVVIPMTGGLTRAAGQQSYLNAMLFERPTIVSDSLGVRDHIRDGITGHVVDGSVDDYVRALRAVLDDRRAEEVQRMCRAAADDVRGRFSFTAHTDRLLEIIDEAAATATA
ncbi:glycosyltransferase [Geodermatophilus sp. URMC 61]|uniref:glycosyltransferase n=1 Tax=Geodermatophilus sp. URMC 61 TaxID=3423411 RepID=UPI00406D266B